MVLTGAALDVTATVANTGDRPGGHVVQAYATRPAGERFLVGFARVECAPGARVPVRIEVPLQRLATRRGPGRWEVPAGEYRIDVGASAADPASVAVPVQIFR